MSDRWTGWLRRQVREIDAVSGDYATKAGHPVKGTAAFVLTVVLVGAALVGAIATRLCSLAASAVRRARNRSSKAR